MAIQTIYTQVDNAKLEPCKKGKPVPPLKVPLLRNNYLGEYRTQVEKDKVLKNLGILGATGKYTYPSDTQVDSYKDIKTVQQALDYCIRLIQSYEVSDKNIKQLIEDVQTIQQNITGLQTSIQQNTENITTINDSIEQINNQILEFDRKLEELNVDDKITNRINQHLANSKTIELVENTLEVKISQEENNAVQAKEDGIYIQDNTKQVNDNTQAIESLQDSDKYITKTSGPSPYTVGGIQEGTTAESLTGKSISDILDLMLFPVYVRELVYPTLQYSLMPSLVEVGSSIQKPELTFTQNDAGTKTSTVETVQYNGLDYNQDTYHSIGTYVFKATVEYSEGQYLINNKGEITNIRVEAGSISTSTSTVATYPWYAGSVNQVFKQPLIAFGTKSEILEISLSGKAVIKLPGANTQLLSFKVNGGLGFLNVDLDSWEQTTEQINGITYKVWTKKDEYLSVLPHQLQFNLAQ